MSSTNIPEEKRLGPDADFIGAGDDVVILGRGIEGILVDADGDAALVRDRRRPDADWITVSFSELAHPDSEAARAEA